ncbi:MAG: leucyl/phenylalanyl-tRNA--protein transferase [Balneolaceae bacterium]
MKIISPEVLLTGYRQGIFPMSDSRYDEDVNWYTAPIRGVIPIHKFHAPKNLRRLIRQNKFGIKINTQFRKVIEGCAQRETTWINDLIINTFDILNQMGHAHSVEVYADNELVGGLYGVHLGAAFFGESMFNTAPEADKVALYYCHQILKKNEFLLWDTQFYTEHLGRFGCEEIEAKVYDKLLQKALKKEAEFVL